MTTTELREIKIQKAVFLKREYVIIDTDLEFNQVKIVSNLTAPRWVKAKDVKLKEDELV